MVNCASPAYIARFGMPRHPEDLGGHRLIHYVSTLGTRDPGFEYLGPDAAGSVRYVAMKGALTVNNWLS